MESTEATFENIKILVQQECARFNQAYNGGMYPVLEVNDPPTQADLSPSSLNTRKDSKKISLALWKYPEPSKGDSEESVGGGGGGGLDKEKSNKTPWLEKYFDVQNGTHDLVSYLVQLKAAVCEASRKKVPEIFLYHIQFDETDFEAVENHYTTLPPEVDKTKTPKTTWEDEAIDSKWPEVQIIPGIFSKSVSTEATDSTKLHIEDYNMTTSMNTLKDTVKKGNQFSWYEQVVFNDAEGKTKPKKLLLSVKLKTTTPEKK